VRNHHDQGFLEATWTHLRTARHLAWPSAVRTKPSPSRPAPVVPAPTARAEQPAETETPPAQVIPLPLFDARKEAEKWW
jgi:hypothetical protein